MNRTCRIHIFGASGSGVSTLGRALADSLATQAFDTDDFFWLPTNPPFTRKRPAASRLALMQDLFVPRRDWVLTGSLMGWGDPLLAQFDLVVFLRLDPADRLERLRQREVKRYGEAAIAPGGDHHRAFSSFMDWAAGYDDPAFAGRSLAGHLAWLDTVPCPAMTLDSSAPVATLVRDVAAEMAWMNRPQTEEKRPLASHFDRQDG